MLVPGCTWEAARSRTRDLMAKTHSPCQKVPPPSCHHHLMEEMVTTGVTTSLSVATVQILNMLTASRDWLVGEFFSLEVADVTIDVTMDKRENFALLGIKFMSKENFNNWLLLFSCTTLICNLVILFVVLIFAREKPTEDMYLINTNWSSYPIVHYLNLLQWTASNPKRWSLHH